MLNGLAAYIFRGNNSHNNNNSVPTWSNVDENNIDENVSADDDEDWILVDKNENNSECSDIELLTLPPSRASSCSSSPLTPDWNLTPPSCFERSNSQSNNDSETNSNNFSSDLEISVFENLLIEHPSISVYYRYPRSVISQQLSVRSATRSESKENRIVDDGNDDAQEQSHSNRYRSSASLVCERGKNSLDHWFHYKPLSVSSSIIDQQRLENIEKSRKLCPSRLRRQNLLVQQKTFCSTKKLRQLQ